jgi:hypothetical protein
MTKARRRRPVAAQLLTPPPGPASEWVISVWKAANAPEEYRRLYPDDDADWFVFIPAPLANLYISWLDSIDYDRRPMVRHVQNGVVAIGRR